MKHLDKLYKVIILALVIMTTGFLCLFFAVMLFTKDTNEGRAYKSRQALCIDFAQSYLRTVPKTEADYNNEKWNMAVDVETDLYNLCSLNLNQESLKNFQLSALEKYKQ